MGRSSRNVLLPSEHRFLTVSRSLISTGYEGAAATLVAGQGGSAGEAREALSPAAMALFKGSLARGCARQILMRGGWRRELWIDAHDEPRWGRIWERHRPMPPLRFTASSFELCRWLSEGATDNSSLGDGPRELSSGDELVVMLAYELVADEGLMVANLSKTLLAQSSVLAWLCFPEHLARQCECPLDTEGIVRFISKDHGLLLEALSQDLTKRWIAIERSKADITEASELTRLGSVQQVALDAYLDAIDVLGRRDLASFIVDAARVLVPPNVSSREVAGLYRAELSSRETLAERHAALRGAGAFFRAALRIGRWNEAHRTTRIFDDGYDRDQALLTKWEAVGPAGFERIEAMLRELEGVDSAASR